MPSISNYLLGMTHDEICHPEVRAKWKANVGVYWIELFHLFCRGKDDPLGYNHFKFSVKSPSGWDYHEEDGVGICVNGFTVAPVQLKHENSGSVPVKFRGMLSFIHVGFEVVPCKNGFEVMFDVKYPFYYRRPEVECAMKVCRPVTQESTWVEFNLSYKEEEYVPGI